MRIEQIIEAAPPAELAVMQAELARAQAALDELRSFVETAGSVSGADIPAVDTPETAGTDGTPSEPPLAPLAPHIAEATRIVVRRLRHVGAGVRSQIAAAEADLEGLRSQQAELDTQVAGFEAALNA